MKKGQEPKVIFCYIESSRPAWAMCLEIQVQKQNNNKTKKKLEFFNLIGGKLFLDFVTFLLTMDYTCKYMETIID